MKFTSGSPIIGRLTEPSWWMTVPTGGYPHICCGVCTDAYTVFTQNTETPKVLTILVLKFELVHFYTCKNFCSVFWYFFFYFSTKTLSVIIERVLGYSLHKMSAHFYAFFLNKKKIPSMPSAGLDGSVGWASYRWSGGHGFDPWRVRQQSFIKIDHEILSTVILSILLIQEVQVSISCERMYTSTG